MDKSKLHWAADADRAPEPVQRTAPDPPKRTAPLGIGPAVPAGEIDLAVRLASANGESSAISLPAGLTLLELKATLHHKGKLHHQVRC